LHLMVKAAAVANQKKSKGVKKEAEATGSQEGVASKAHLSTIDKQAVTWIWNHLVANPAIILITKAHLEAGLITNKRADEEDAYFHKTYTIFKHIKKEFLAKVIAYAGKAYGITEEVVDAMDNRSRHAVRQVAAYFFGVDDGTRIPRPCLEKAVMWKFLLSRGQQLGERWKTFKGSVLREDMSLNWQTHGCFHFSWGQNTVSQIQHSSGAIADNLPVNITPAWKLDNNYHDLLAGVSLGMISPRLREFFDDDAEFFASYSQERMNDLAKKIKDDIQAQRDAQGEKAASLNVLHSAKAAVKERAQGRRPPPAAEKLGVPLTIPAQSTD